MSKQAHTPGPWSVAADLTNRGRFEIVAPDPECGDTWSICEVEWMAGRGPDPAEANARMIVRAVNCHADLLSACKAALHHLTDIMDGNHGEHQENPIPAQLRAAIAKAEAEA